MKRKWIAVCLLLVLLLTTVPFQADAANDVCFVSINDTLPESIPFAYVSGGVAYIPCSALSTFRIYNLYDTNINTVLVYTSSQQITIDMNNGIATDADGVEYSATAIYRNGQVYVPAGFICPMFGLSASYINGVGYGDICRITDGSQVLGDELFLSAATNQMKNRYNAYQESLTPPPPTTTNTPEPEDEDHGDTTVYFTFTGIPSNFLLNLLKNYAITATFFLDSKDITSDPETVRRIVGEGHQLGIYCPDGTLQSFQTTAELLFEASHVKTVLVTAGEATSQAFRTECDAAGLVPCEYDINGLKGGVGLTNTGGVTGRLNSATGDVVTMLTLTEENDSIIRSIVYYVYTNSFDFGTVREVGYTGGSQHVN